MLLPPLLSLLLAAPSAVLAMDIHEASAPAGVAAMTAWLDSHPEGITGSFVLSGEGFRCLPQGCTQGAGWSLQGDGARGYISFLGDFTGELSPERLQAQISYVIPPRENSRLRRSSCLGCLSVPSGHGVPTEAVFVRRTPPGSV